MTRTTPTYVEIWTTALIPASSAIYILISTKQFHKANLKASAAENVYKIKINKLTFIRNIKFYKWNAL